MSLTITAAQRDALYEHLYIRLSGIEAVWFAVSAGDYARAENLGREFSDALLLVLDDLGWGEHRGEEEIELTTPPKVLRRVLRRLRDAAALQIETEERERADRARTEGEQNQLVKDTCESVLASIGETG